MDIKTPLKSPEAQLAYGELQRAGTPILLRDLYRLAPEKVAKFDYVKQMGVTAEDIARAAGRQNGREARG